MAGVTQTILYDADAERRGVLGNCLQAAVAAAMGLELGAVPHFAAFTWWEPAARLWLRGRGLDWQMKPGIPAGRSIVVGRSPRQTGAHAVVGQDGEIVWDPHPDRSGLVDVIHSYLLVQWPVPGEPSACVACGAR